MNHQPLLKSDLQTKICESGVIAVLIVEDPADTKPLIEALLAGGVRSVELTLRTEKAMEALEIVKREYPEVLLGAGTVIRPEQVGTLKSIGVDFGVAPGTNRKVLEACAAEGLPFAPGVATASDIETALEFGARLLKYFPAEPLGGLASLKSMAAPYSFLGLSFIPLGGINAANCGDYFASPLVGAIGGSWLAPASLIKAKEWKHIEANAEEAVRIFNQAKNTK